MTEDPQRAIFKTASSITPRKALQKHYETLECGNAKRFGCKVLKRSRELYYCAICEMLRAKGQDFFDIEGTLTPNEIQKMNKKQNEDHKKLRPYWEHWLQTYAKGAL